jgi:hypothetical protein
MSYLISCPNKGVCPVELLYFLPAERRLPRICDFLSCPLKRVLHGYMIFFPARREASAGDIIFFPAR